jgi:hypothetical protein
MRRILLCAAMVLAVGAVAEAQVIWDYGPTTGTTGTCWSNYTASQNFAEEIVFANPTVVNGMDIWTCIAPTAGTVHIKILLDNGSGAPGAVFTEWDQAPTIWIADGPGYMVSADFADVNLTAGQTYWIGMSGNGFELGQYSVSTPGDGVLAEFSGSSFLLLAALGDQMFQLRGSALASGSIPTLGGVGIVVMMLLLVSAGIILVRRLR